MAKTPFVDLKSEDILSAHISGIQHTVNKIEEILNLGTAAKVNHVLIPVADQADPTLHNFIYEGTIRNWLTSPAPVVKRNGEVVDPAEYDIQPAYGVVVFKVQQGAENEITADFSHVINSSVVISNLNTEVAKIGGLDTRLTAAEGAITDLDSRVDELELNGGGSTGGSGGDINYSSGGGTLEPDGTFTVPTGDAWVTNSTLAAPGYTVDIATAGNLLEAFPIYIKERTIFDKIRIEVTKQNYTGVKGLMGVYSSANGLPHKRLAQTTSYDETVGIKEQPFTSGDLILEAGVYWIARFSSAGTQYKAILDTDSIKLNLPTGFPANSGNGTGKPGALRANWANNAALPAEWPAGAVSLQRSNYTSPQVHVKKTY